VNDQHVFYRAKTLYILRLAGAVILLILLLAEWYFGLPAMFGMHAALALLASVILALIATAVGHLYDRAQSAYVDD
jgi:hypothetical protein